MIGTLGAAAAASPRITARSEIATDTLRPEATDPDRVPADCAGRASGLRRMPNLGVESSLSPVVLGAEARAAEWASVATRCGPPGSRLSQAKRTPVPNGHGRGVR